LDVLSEAEIQFLSSRVGTLESIARRYLRVIFASLVNSKYFPRPRRPGFNISLSQATGAPGTEYTGPTDMAEYYANVEALSASFIRVGLER